jgi:SNF2 family DNA or RNA helicase
MLTDKLTFVQRTKLKIAQTVAPIKQTHVTTFEQVDFELSQPNLSSILDIEIIPSKISIDYTLTNNKSDVQNIDFLNEEIIVSDFSQFNIKITTPEIYDVISFTNLFDFEVEIENIEFHFIKTPISGKNFIKNIEPTQASLFSDFDNQLENRNDKKSNSEKKNKAKNKNEQIDIFDLIFPALQPPLGKHFNNSISFNGKTLYPFQVDGVKFLHSSTTVLLGDEMGLGKSIQTITAARFLFREGKISTACIICPKAVLTDWEKKIWDWAPELRTVKISGDKTQREIQWLTPSHFYICTYETLLKDVFDKIKTSSDVRITAKGHSVICPNPECGKRTLVPYALFFERGLCPHCNFSSIYPNSEDVQASKFDLLILDEIQKTKNPSAKTTKAVRAIKSTYKWALSGTPLENKVEDLITICETIKPDIFKNINPYIRSQLIEAYKPIFLRRKKEDALKDLPPKITKEVWLDLLPSQRKKYDLAEKQGVVDLEEKGEQLTIQHILALITKLKQICNYDIVENESCKLDYLMEELEELTEQGDKALVFSQYPNETLKRLLPHLKQYNPDIYDGSLSDQKRTKMIDDFQQTDNSKLLLLSLKAGNSGITLTRANYVYHFDLWWNPAVSAQAVDRAHRIGQTKTVFERLLLAEDTIERRIYNILAVKKRLFSELVDGLSDTELLTQTLTESEIFGLFGLTKNKPQPKKDKQNNSNDFNLLDPFAFEHFIGDLFVKMGYYSKVTKKSNDGGIDIFAKLQTPTGADEVIIQCKHKEDPNSTVGVDKVRELFGVLSANRKLTKGFLITNGKFTSGAYDFANGKLIELIDGTKLKGYVEIYS